MSGCLKWDCISTSLWSWRSTPAFSSWVLNSTFRARINLLYIPCQVNIFELSFTQEVADVKILQSPLPFLRVFSFLSVPFQNYFQKLWAGAAHSTGGCWAGRQVEECWQLAAFWHEASFCACEGTRWEELEGHRTLWAWPLLANPRFWEGICSVTKSRFGPKGIVVLAGQEAQFSLHLSMSSTGRILPLTEAFKYPWSSAVFCLMCI